MLVLSALEAVACPRTAGPASKALASRPRVVRPFRLALVATVLIDAALKTNVPSVALISVLTKPKKACTSKGKERANDPTRNGLVNGNLTPKDIPLSSIKPAFSVPASISAGPIVVDIANYNLSNPLVLAIY
ncbi:hypothetical protein V498_08155 [Pseudogymnoascus sp. VKM F-4517 (FW-2822)]|nr:hypothetical protein V498_08155 [Pseudogymnoascus sp. VKM F-4517 (FW-2822)]